MLQTTNNKQYNLEDRTLQFAKDVIKLCKLLPNNTVNFKLIDQIVRSAASVGANYREANDTLGNKDFVYRLRISRKEAKETSFWLELILDSNPDQNKNVAILMDECIQLRNILSAIIAKSEK
jgi:four helix bundle protein